MKLDSIYSYFSDLTGGHLDQGYIYIGVPNLNPETNPVQVYWDSEFLIPAAQPLRTINGHIARNGTQSNVFIKTNFSITVKNKQFQFVSNIQDSSKLFGLSLNNLNTVSNIVGLKQQDKTKVSTCKTLGYYSENDGGDGEYYLDLGDSTSLDNGGTIIVAIDGGRWKLKFKDAVYIKQFGAYGDSDGTPLNGHDDTAAIQKAFLWASSSGFKAKLKLTEGIFRTSSVLNAFGGFVLEGVSPKIKNITGANVGGGSWLYFNHLGKGINCNGVFTYASSFNFLNFATLRDQPPNSISWVPYNSDYDISIENCYDVNISNCVLFNCTKGISAVGSGRVVINNLKGQPLSKGIFIDNSFDAVEIKNIHFWPFWRDERNTHVYCLNNLDAVDLGYCNNPVLSNLYSIYAKTGIKFSKTASGVPNGVKVVDANFDFGNFGMFVDPLINTSTTGQFLNINHTADVSFQSSSGLFILGSNCNFDFVNFKTSNSYNNGIRIEGFNNKIKIQNLNIDNYNISNIGFPAIEVYASNVVEILGTPIIKGAPANIEYSTTGIIKSNQWRSFIPAVSSAFNSISSLGSTNGRFKLEGNLLSIKFLINISVNGLASGDLRFPLPSVGVAGQYPSTGCGKLLSGDFRQLQVFCSDGLGGGSSTVQITDYLNGYAGANNARLIGSIDVLTNL